MALLVGKQSRVGVVLAGIVMAALGVVTPAGQSVTAAPPGDDQVVAFLVRGVGNGHGRGLSQWGAYGRAVNGGQTWTQILEAYYGNTTMGSAGDPNFGVRITALDNASTLGVISEIGDARWNGFAFASMYAEETFTPNVFNVYAATTRACPGETADWTQIGTNVAGPIVFSTTEPANTSEPRRVLGACRLDGTIRHYRGTIELIHTSSGNRVVNRLDIEQYLRGVVPREVPATWGIAGGGAGMHALRAQAVAARSYALSQNRYASIGAKTCDTSSCQVYGGAGSRPTSTAAGFEPLEHVQTDTAIANTAGSVRLLNGVVASTEFSASNGPYTAGGTYPWVDDPWDDVNCPTRGCGTGNPHHRWTRLIDADDVVQRYQLTSATGVKTAPDPQSDFQGIWDNAVFSGTGARLASAWEFRNAYGLPSPGFELLPITRGVAASTFSMIGDSVGEGVALQETSVFRIALDGVFTSSTFDVKLSRRTQGGAVQPDGVAAAAAVPEGTELVLVELGYNDPASGMGARIDALMGALRDRSVGRVAWVNLSERRPEMAAINTALEEAQGRWPEMTVLDWESASSGDAKNRWFADGVHLTNTGNAEFALFLRDEVVRLSGGTVAPRRLVPGYPLRVPVLGRAGVPEQGVAGVALNVTAVNPGGAGFLRVWPCGSPEPSTSSVNFVSAGAIEPNAVLAGVDETGEVCISTLTATDVLVDVTGWFDAGFAGADIRLADTVVQPGAPLRVPVVNSESPAGVTGVALNVTAAQPQGPGFLRVWPCGSPEPETSSVNFTRANVVEPNAVVVGVDSTGEVCLSTLTPTRVVVDQSGWFQGGLQSAAGRLVDTRLEADGGALSLVPGTPLRVPVLGAAGVPESGASGVALNVTAVNTGGPGFLRVWPCSAAEPDTSSVNYMSAGAVEPNAVVVGTGDSGEICVSTLTATDVIVDVSGWFDTGLNPAGGRIVDTR